MLDPAALAGAPHTHIATVYASPEAEAPLLRAVADAYPNVTAIGVREAHRPGRRDARRHRRRHPLGRGGDALTGFVVLIGAAAAGERRRVFEAAVLKTLGASRGRASSRASRCAPALTGAAAGLVAIAAGGVAGWWVTTFVLEGDFRFEPVTRPRHRRRRRAREPPRRASPSRSARWRRGRRGCCARGSDRGTARPRVGDNARIFAILTGTRRTRPVEKRLRAPDIATGTPRQRGSGLTEGI